MEQPYLYYITWGEGGSPTPSILPKELQACEYIQSDSNSAIQLNYAASPDCVLETHMKRVGTSLNTALFGTRQKWQQRMWEFLINTNNLYGVGLNNANQAQVINRNPGDDVIIFGPPSLKINNNNYTTQSYTNGNNYNVVLFSCYDGDSQSIFSPTYEGQMYYCKIYDTNMQLRLDLYPCYVKTGETFIDTKGNTCAPDTPGLFDIINNNFYTNDLGGTFTVGPDIIL